MSYREKFHLYGWMHQGAPSLFVQLKKISAMRLDTLKSIQPIHKVSGSATGIFLHFLEIIP
jgi:hypothetical protein